MSDTRSTPLAGRRWMALAAGAVLTLALAACSSAASPGTSTTSSSSMAAHESMGASASQPADARCAVTPDASANATVQIAGSAFGAEVTIQAGQAVVFTNQDLERHTVTEGTAGQPADNACVDKLFAGGSSVMVTFNQPGDYQITCTLHSAMQTVVHVQ